MTTTGPAPETAAETTEVPFHLRGNYAPVTDEVTGFDLPVEGALPAELSGLFVRNGPNPHTGRSPHWFTGDGMLHGIRLESGRAAWYRNRYVQTRALNEPDARVLGEDGTMDRTVGVNNTHVIRHAGRILALVESSFPCEVATDLSTVGVHDFGGRLNSAMTAHPKTCPITGELHFFGYGFFEPYLTYHRVSPDGELVQSQVIDVPGSTMIHDFAITADHVIFLDLPVVFHLDLAIRGGMPYRFDDGYGARLGVMPRQRGEAVPASAEPVEVQWFEVEPCYVFHTLNAYVDGSEVVVDGARYPELWRMGSGSFDQAFLHRWRLDTATGTASEASLDDRAIEFPRCHEGRTGLDNRFGYAVASAGQGGGEGGGPAHNALIKYDLTTGEAATHDFGGEQIPGEPVFAPASGDGAEDDGWLMTYVYDRPSDTSRFVVLDATNLGAPPVASITVPQRVPFGFHGSWLAD